MNSSTDTAVFLFILAACGSLAAWIAVSRWRRQVHLRTQRMAVERMQSANDGVPPFRVAVNEAADFSWIFPGAVEAIAAEVRALGFADAGVFDVKPVAIRMLAFLDHQRMIWCMICEEPQIGLWLQVTSECEDGTYISYTTESTATVFDSAPYQIIKAFPGANAQQLLNSFLAERPNRALKPTTAERFPDFIERSWARVMDWRISRGGPTADEINRFAAQHGKQATPEMIETVQRKWRTAIERFRQNDGIGTE